MAKVQLKAGVSKAQGAAELRTIGVSLNLTSITHYPLLPHVCGKTQQRIEIIFLIIFDNF